MEISSKPSSNPYTFDYNVKVEVSPASFRFLDVFNLLDFDALKKSEKSRIEIGTVETECCRQIVHGRIEKGMLTAIEFESTEAQQTQVNPQLLDLLNAANKALGQHQRVTRALPVPLSELMTSPDIVIQTWTCTRICVFGVCFTCCSGNDPHGPWSTCAPGVASSTRVFL